MSTYHVKQKVSLNDKYYVYYIKDNPFNIILKCIGK